MFFICFLSCASGRYRLVQPFFKYSGSHDRDPEHESERRKPDPHSCHVRVPSFVTSEAASVLVTLDVIGETRLRARCPR